MNEMFLGKPNKDIENYIISKFPTETVNLLNDGQQILIKGPGYINFIRKQSMVTEQYMYPYQDHYIIERHTTYLVYCRVFVNDILWADFTKQYIPSNELKNGDNIRLEYMEHYIATATDTKTGQIRLIEEKDNYSMNNKIGEITCVFKKSY